MAVRSKQELMTFAVGGGAVPVAQWENYPFTLGGASRSVD